MKIELLIGNEAEALLCNTEFREQWKALYERCFWGSVFQSEDFVVTWYNTYKSQFSPAIVTGVSPDGELVGLFTLAIEVKSGQLVVAGASEAEYHAWLAEPFLGNTFIESALDTLKKKFPKKTLTLLFVLSTVPIEWARPEGGWGRHCRINTLPRGLMKIEDGSRFRETLRKKKQSKINRLKRLGNLHLDQIEKPEELGAVFDEIIDYQAFRLRGVQNLPNVEHDPLKKTFYMNLMRLPKMIYATALRVDSNLVSAQIHNYNKEEVRLGLITHSPFYAKYSPGELHILMTGAELAKEEISFFDLTPGGSYKDRYATDYDEVYVINIFFNRLSYSKYRIKRGLAEIVKSTARGLGLTPEQAKEAFLTFLDWRQKWARQKWKNLLLEIFGRLKKSVRDVDELCVYTCDLPQSHRASGLSLIKRDHLPDLLSYQPAEVWQLPVNRFMKRALENLEAGHHFYTCVGDGKSQHYGWLIEPRGQKSVAGVTGEEQIPVIPTDAVQLIDFYTNEREPDLFLSLLCQMLDDAAKISGAKRACTYVSAGSPVLREMIEKAGFTYQYSVFKKTVLGKTTSWATIEI